MRWIPLLLLLLGCLKPTLVQAPTPLPVAVWTVQNQGVPEPAPTPLSQQIFAEVERRGLRAEEGTLPATDAQASLTVESTARFSSQINGRYRWTVAVTATLAPPDGSPMTRSFTVPVHLVYYHDKEAEALVEATPLIARQVGDLLDTWIRSL
jgi:hypothetical protein